VKQVQPVPPLQGTTAPEPLTALQSMLQQSPFWVHAWPSFAQVLLPEPEPEPVPPHVPYVWPDWKMQVVPLQQSALLVHWAPAMTQLPLPHCSWPLPLGTHGAPLQQSPENAHAEPAIWQPEPRP